MGLSEELLKNFPNRTIGSITQRASRLGIKYVGVNKNNKRVVCVETNVIFDSLNEAYKFVSIKPNGGITKACRSPKVTCGGYHWKYVEEE